MGVLFNLTEEYFRKEKRTENITLFDKYLEHVEWVDFGHPEYLFAKYDFINEKAVDDMDYFNEYRFSVPDLDVMLNNTKSCYKPITEEIIWWLFENREEFIFTTTTSLEALTLAKKDEKKNRKEITFGFGYSSDKYNFTSYCKKNSSGDDFYTTWFSFSNVDAYNKRKTKTEKELDLVDGDNTFHIKMMKLKK